jgi:hypothetical protein
MVGEVEHDFELPAAIRNGRLNAAARGDAKRHIPPMIDQRGELQDDLAGNLGPKLQGSQVSLHARAAGRAMTDCRSTSTLLTGILGRAGPAQTLCTLNQERHQALSR